MNQSIKKRKQLIIKKILTDDEERSDKRNERDIGEGALKRVFTQMTFESKTRQAREARHQKERNHHVANSHKHRHR